MTAFRLLPAVLLLAFACSAQAATDPAVPTVVRPADLHLDRLHPGTTTYLVYMHGAAGQGPAGPAVERAMLATSTVSRERVDGVDAWVIEQHWEDETGTVHTARTVHAASDIATLAQTTTWKRPDRSMTITVDPARARGDIAGDVPEATRQRMESGFATMDEGWWMNWHSDLALLPLLPYERGGTLRIHLFDVGMEAPMDVDYTVLGERVLPAPGGTSRRCWLVETESGHPGSGNVQRFWIDTAQRVVVKEEDIFNGRYRSKILLAVPAVVEFPLPPAPAATGTPAPAGGA